MAGHLDNQFGYDKSTQKWFEKQTKEILSVYRQGHCEYHGLENFEVKYELVDLWINYMKPGDFNPTKLVEDLSFVIFFGVLKELDKERIMTSTEALHHQVLYVLIMALNRNLHGQELEFILCQGTGACTYSHHY